MNEIQKKLYNANIDLAEVLAMNATCVEADYEMLEPAALKALAEAVVKYDKTKHGSFEQYATIHINSKVVRIINCY